MELETKGAVPFPHQHVIDALLRSPERWVPGLVEAAGEHGERVLAGVGFRMAGRSVHHRVVVTIGEPVFGERCMTMPMTWVPAGRFAGLFPTLRARIEVCAQETPGTRIMVKAVYDPPLGGLGRALDQAVLHRAAEATVRDFSERLTRTIAAMVAAQGA